MNRRTACGVLIVLLLIFGGRLVRSRLLVGPDGQWREPEYLADLLPALEQKEPERPRKRELSAPLEINTATADSLVLLPGVGPVLAGRILEDIAANGPFTSLCDLQRVKGIGPAVAERIAPYLIFGPAGCDEKK